MDVTANEHTFPIMARQLMRDIDEHFAELDAELDPAPEYASRHRRPEPLPRPCVCGPAGIYAHEPFCTGPPVHPG